MVNRITKSLNINKNEIIKFYDLVLELQWPINYELFLSKLNKKEALEYYKNNQLIGLLLYEKNSIFLIMVLPQYQRQGIGSELIKHFSKDKKEIKVASGCGEYLWPGVPSDMTPAINLFEKLGFSSYEKSYDLFIYLKNLNIDKKLYKNMEDKNIKFSFANKDNIELILEFEKKHFPNWFNYFDQNKNNYNNILIASKDNEIYASTLLFGPSPYIWDKKLNYKIGGFGCLGTKNSERNTGIGLALAQYASEQLLKREIHISILGWTWLVDWYGRLGYKIWKEYNMMRKIK